MAADAWSARAYVALGTLIEIRLAASEARMERFDRAFAAIEHVHHCMSAHDGDSDLARIARRAHRSTVAVDAQTFEVLVLAKHLFDASNGRFDVTQAVRRRRGGTLAALELVAPRHVRANRPIALDLGGIAKGYAVDRAIAALRAAGATRGSVNAGGDLRVFGGEWMPLQIRDPRAPTSRFVLGSISDCAAATSADYRRDGGAVLLDRDATTPQRFPASVTVVAKTCAHADALTKCVALDPRGAPALLARFGAHAFLIEVDASAITCHRAGRASPHSLRLAA